MKTKYFEIDNRRFKLEKVREDLYWLTVKWKLGTQSFSFKGVTAYADAMAEILSYSEIDQAYWED